MQTSAIDALSTIYTNLCNPAQQADKNEAHWKFGFNKIEWIKRSEISTYSFTHFLGLGSSSYMPLIQHIDRLVVEAFEESKKDPSSQKHNVHQIFKMREKIMEAAFEHLYSKIPTLSQRIFFGFHFFSNLPKEMCRFFFQVVKGDNRFVKLYDLHIVKYQSCNKIFQSYLPQTIWHSGDRITKAEFFIDNCEMVLQLKKDNEFLAKLAFYSSDTNIYVSSFYAQDTNANFSAEFFTVFLTHLTQKNHFTLINKSTLKLSEKPLARTNGFAILSTSDLQRLTDTAIKQGFLQLLPIEKILDALSKI